MYGKASYMVRCCRVVEGKPCPGMIDIPLGGKAACPRCGALYNGPAHYFAERGKIVIKSPVQVFGPKAEAA